MARAFAGKFCVLCGSVPSSRQGEHVWPRWYLEDFPGGPGPYGWLRNGEPLRRRNETPVIERDVTRVRLPMCTSCNGSLNRRFEQPAKPLVRRLFGGPPLPRLTGTEVTAVAAWLLKTWILLPHPEVFYAHPLIDRAHLRMKWLSPAEPEYYRWLTSGDAPPAGLSLWLHRAGDLEGPPPGADRRLVLPTVHEGGRSIRFESHEVTLHGLTVTLAVHPGWPIDHPLERDGRAVRLWPDPPGGFDFEALPPVRRSEGVAWSRGLQVDLRPGALGSGLLPPLALGSTPALALIGTELVSSVRLVAGR